MNLRGVSTLVLILGALLLISSEGWSKIIKKPGPKVAKTSLTPVPKVVTPKVPKTAAVPVIKTKPQPKRGVPPSLEVAVSEFAAFLPESNVRSWTLFGVQLAPDLHAVRLDSSVGWRQLAQGFRIFRIAEKYVRMQLIEIDSQTGWALFSSGQTSISLDLRNTSAVLPQRFLAKVTGGDIQKDFEIFMRRMNVSRVLASTSDKVDIIKRDFLQMERDLLSEVNSPKGRLGVGGFTLGPRIKGLRCQLLATSFKDSDLRFSVKKASGFDCTAGTLREDFKDIGMRLRSGVIELKPSVSINDSVTSRLLEAVAKKEMAEHESSSEEIEFSSPASCSRSRLKLNGIEGAFCTRNLPLLYDFQDTVTSFGRVSGNKFIYAIVRTKAFSPEGTIQMVDSVMSFLGEPYGQ